MTPHPGPGDGIRRRLIHPALADATFAVVRAQTRIANRLQLPAISTGRPFAFYRRVFFQGRRAEDVLAELQGRVIADVGCGLTPFVPDSMFQACHAAGIEFFAVDPKLGEGFRLGRFDRLKTLVNRGATPDPLAPGAERRIAALAGSLPFDAGSLDLILSSWFLFVWLDHGRTLDDVFRELIRVLRPGGELRVYPTPRWSERRIDLQLWNTVAGAFDVDQVFFGSPDLANLAPGYMTRFTKRVGPEPGTARA